MSSIELTWQPSFVGTADKRRHRRSKTACLNCKSRKMKCGEEKPECRKCQNRLIPCVYKTIPDGFAIDALGKKQPKNGRAENSRFQDPNLPEPSTVHGMVPPCLPPQGSRVGDLTSSPLEHQTYPAPTVQSTLGLPRSFPPPSCGSTPAACPPPSGHVKIRAIKAGDQPYTHSQPSQPPHPTPSDIASQETYNQSPEKNFSAHPVVSSHISSSLVDSSAPIADPIHPTGVTTKLSKASVSRGKGRSCLRCQKYHMRCGRERPACSKCGTDNDCTYPETRLSGKLRKKSLNQRYSSYHHPQTPPSGCTSSIKPGDAASKPITPNESSGSSTPAGNLPDAPSLKAEPRSNAGFECPASPPILPPAHHPGGGATPEINLSGHRLPDEQRQHPQSYALYLQHLFY